MLGREHFWVSGEDRPGHWYLPAQESRTADVYKDIERMFYLHFQSGFRGYGKRDVSH